MIVSVIVPAYNEEKNIKTTLKAIKKAGFADEVVGVNDGSRDKTGKILEKYCDKTISFIKNHGKTTAVQVGWLACRGDIIVILDADLKESAMHGAKLIEPLINNEADLIIGAVKNTKSGFGFVKKRVQRLIEKKCGVYLEMPLSGQRAFLRKHLNDYQEVKADGFGLETMMTLKAIEKGFTIKEIEAPFVHIGKGKGPFGWWHRGKQWVEVERSLWKYGKSSL
ncbi:glycosyltransferase family 2 protein [Aliibacillus thermotolerans]|uniref:Glycosyltransferase family 2 protein n=1 Tax=Aliibacillus thermotolerans TaxID=1834418 RepID=A0ABW0U6X5_9BACI|nr:glycosyltransferase family 2 protein [Aliibacillus thermotolerans]MDA3131150.1 glycosyltransferase [Aliibacillus thermotolerans]